MSSQAGAPRRPRRGKPPAAPRALGEPPPGLFPSSGELLRLAAVVAIAAATAAACKLAAGLLTRRPKPFCDTSFDPLSSSYDLCEPCPKNGQCIDGKLECVHGFRKYGKICVEDGLISQTAKKLSESLERWICDEHARVLCGEAGRIWFEEDNVVKMVTDQLSKSSIGLSEDGIKVAKDKVMDSARSFFETKLANNGTEEFKCPELLAELHKPLTCQVQQWVYKHILSVVVFCILFVGLLRIVWSIYQRRAVSSRAEQIYQQVCEVLEDNAMNAEGANHESERWVVGSWLRDHLLLPRERRNALLWKKVEELILEDSRIDQYPKLIKGESKVVFEWQASGSLSAKVKKMQATSRARSRGVAARSAEEMDAHMGEAGRQLSRGSPHEEGTKARSGAFM